MFPKARRYLIWKWSQEEDWHEAIECALRADNSSPGAGFCLSLSGGHWSADPEFEPPTDVDQIADWAKLYAKMEYVGRNGQPARANDVNYLHSGIWEFKHGARRLTYWDTDGRGNYTPKAKHREPSERDSEPPADGYWWYPDMDAVLRLGCAWPKTEQAAPQPKIDEAREIREEDCARDRQPQTPGEAPEA